MHHETVLEFSLPCENDNKISSQDRIKNDQKNHDLLKKHPIT